MRAAACSGTLRDVAAQTPLPIHVTQTACATAAGCLLPVAVVHPGAGVAATTARQPHVTASRRCTHQRPPALFQPAAATTAAASAGRQGACWLTAAKPALASLLLQCTYHCCCCTQLSLARRASRTLKLRRGASGSSTGQLVQQGSVDAGTGASLVEAAADAAHGAPAAAVANGDGPAAGPTTGAAGVLQPLGSLSSQGALCWVVSAAAAVPVQLLARRARCLRS